MKIHRVPAWEVYRPVAGHQPLGLTALGEYDRTVYVQSKAVDAIGEGLNVKMVIKERVCVRDRPDYDPRYDGSECYMCRREAKS